MVPQGHRTSFEDVKKAATASIWIPSEVVRHGVTWYGMVRLCQSWIDLGYDPRLCRSKALKAVLQLVPMTDAKAPFRDRPLRRSKPRAGTS